MPSLAVPPLTPDLVVKAVAAASVLCLAVWVRIRRRIQHQISNIPGPESRAWAGNYVLLHDADKGWEFFDEINKDYGNVCRITTPPLCNDLVYIADPLALNHMCRRDENIWDDPPEIHLMLQMVLGTKGLGSTHGAEHIRQRKYLNPIFGASYLKHMPPLFYEVTHRFVQSLKTLCTDGPTEMDMSHWGTRVSLEFVGQGAMGVSLDSLEVDAKPNLYGEDLKGGFVALSIPAARLGVKYFLPRIASLSTPRFNRWLLTLVPSPLVAVIRNFIWELERNSQTMFQEKKNAIINGSDASMGKDLMTAIISEHVLADRPDRVSEQEATSHFRTLLFAATDTSSSAILRTIQLLSEHADVQAALRDEITAAKEEGGGEIAYDKLLALPWLDAVYRETLRLYPPAGFIDRMALQDTVLPLAFPITGRDGTPLHELVLPKGTVVTMSLVGVNRSRAVWGPDADEWRPQRWMEPLPETVKSTKMPGIYSHIMTFLDGKRHCLGYRYVQMELKILISELVAALHFAPSAHADKIAWPMGLTLSPHVDGKMSMPLVLSQA
ncbi:cytochrome P450 [Dentipellis sp. KUC8613]|nr:cytochrome P450 [Dentipellis sp. KUC8613]